MKSGAQNSELYGSNVTSTSKHGESVYLCVFERLCAGDTKLAASIDRSHDPHVKMLLQSAWGLHLIPVCEMFAVVVDL